MGRARHSLLGLINSEPGVCDSRFTVLVSRAVKQSASHRWLILLIFGALALRLAYCAAVGTLGRTGPGYMEYISAGQRLVEHGRLTSPLIFATADARPSALLPPVYAAFVASVYWLFGANTYAATLVLQSANAVAGALTVLFVFFVTRDLGSKRAAWGAALIATINPTLLGFTDYIWDTNLFVLGAIVSVWFSVRLSRGSGGFGRWFGYGLFLGALALLNPALTIGYPFLVLWPVIRSHGWRPRPMLRAVVPAVCGWLLAVTPWSVRNYVQLGELMYVRNGFMLELWLGVCPEADTHGSNVYPKQFPLLNKDIQRRVTSIGEANYLKACGERASEAIRADPWRFVRLCGERTVDYWLGTVFTHARRGGGGWSTKAPRAAVTLFLSLEVLVVAICFVNATDARRNVRWLLAIVFVFSLVYCATHVQSRFRAPTEPLLAIVIALLVSDVGTRWVSRRTGRASDMDRADRSAT